MARQRHRCAGPRSSLGLRRALLARILGPSTTWLLRYLANRLDVSPEGFHLDLAGTAQALGLGSKRGRHSPFMRALCRCCQFDVAEARPDGSMAVRRKLPPLTRRQIHRLSSELIAAQAWQESELRTPAHEQQRRRSRRLALSPIARTSRQPSTSWPGGGSTPPSAARRRSGPPSTTASRFSRPTPIQRRRSHVRRRPGPPPPRPPDDPRSNRTAGRITGPPTTAGTFTLRVTDEGGQQAPSS